MTMPELYERVNAEDIRNQIEDSYRAEQPTYQPSATNPVRIMAGVVAGRETLGRLFFNQRALQVFIDTAVGAGLRTLGSTLGLSANPGELDEPYRIRLRAWNDARGRAGTPSAYKGQALDASQDVADATTAISAAPNAGRVEIHIVAKDDADDGGTLPGVPLQALVDSVQAYMRDTTRRDVRDHRLIAVAAAPTEYRIAVTIVSDIVTEATIRQAIYGYIDAHRVYGAVLRPSNLSTLLENLDFVDAANITAFNVSPYTGVATLTATGIVVYSCQKNTTGVSVTLT